MSKWLKKEVEYLKNKWGEISIISIAKNLNKSINAVKLKANRIGLARHIHSGTNYITINQLFNFLGMGKSYSYTLKRWENNGFKVKLKKSIKKKYKVIKIDAFWKWADTHRNFIDWSKVEKFSLGKEPEWVDTYRIANYHSNKFKVTQWTKEEDSLLTSLVKSYRFSYKEISQRLLRTEGAIKRRLIVLKIKDRPLKADNHTPWTEEEIKIIIELKNKGYTPEAISEKLNRSAQAVRGKFERMAIVE